MSDMRTPQQVERAIALMKFCKRDEKPFVVAMSEALIATLEWVVGRDSTDFEALLADLSSLQSVEQVKERVH